MKTIQGYENYSVAEDGRVFNNKTGRELKCKVERSGYIRVGLCMNNTKSLHSVHRLVALAYIPNPDNKPQVNHKDMNKANNHASNLEWCTMEENHRHAWANGRKETRRKISEAQKGRIGNRKGCKHSDESKRKMSEAKQNMSDETRLKMSEAGKGRIPWNKGKKLTNDIS